MTHRRQSGRRERLSGPCPVVAGARHLELTDPLKMENPAVGISERNKEIKRRRHRRRKLAQLAKRLKKATVSERAVITEKIRALTPGGEVIIKRWGLEER